MALRDAGTAVHRFGLGPRPGEVDKVAAAGAESWLLGQLDGPYKRPKAFEGFLTIPEERRVMIYRYGELMPPLREARDAAKEAGDTARYEKLAADEREILYGFLIWARESLMLELNARTNVAVTTEQPFRERLVHFWSNHLVVPNLKLVAGIHSPAYERDVIHPHVTGKFADMLMAAIKSPAMLIFLDNHVSVGPNSPFGRKSKDGLNENLGREILELHTLGVDGGYTQDDVIALSKGITGWSTLPSGEFGEIAPELRKAVDWGGFHFFADRHEPGAFTLLAKTYAQEGVAQGEAMLNDLARHPSTAKFLARKLATHFVSDVPSDALVKRLADAYLAADTSLAEMTAALVESDEAWENAGTKLKQPHDYAVSVLRALDAPLADGKVWPQTSYKFPDYPWKERRWAAFYNPGVLDVALTGVTLSDFSSDEQRRGLEIAAFFRDVVAMGQPPYSAPGPQGWYDRWSDWNGADSLMKRVEFSLATAERHGDRAGDPRRFVDALLGARASADLKTTVANAATPAQGIGLALASPQFQRR
ncbi:MAG: DUF1800 domain-containing protein [Alphaproteobacteria bacterium]|nr:DUF1800 domain-containing protein [Alphaproteobacteria bacterium]